MDGASCCLLFFFLEKNKKKMDTTKEGTKNTSTDKTGQNHMFEQMSM